MKIVSTPVCRHEGVPLAKRRLARAQRVAAGISFNSTCSLVFDRICTLTPLLCADFRNSGSNHAPSSTLSQANAR